MYGGPTGFESVELVKLLQNDNPDAVWVACMGSDKYLRMEVKVDEIRRAVRSYNVGYEFEVL